jgi:Breast carcinoma amplified sequence 2 (BCAS2)
MDSLPYIDRPNDEEYESYALALIQEEMGLRQARKPPPPIPAGQELRPTGNPLSEQKLAPLSDASSLNDHTIALQRAKRNYESERLRQLQLSVASELEWKDYTDHLAKTLDGPAAAAAAQQSIVDEINHSRQTFQEQVLLPQLVTAERQYQDLVQKNLQLRSAIANVQ